MHKHIYILLAILVIAVLSVSFSRSLFFHAPQRLQLLVYGQDIRVYSLDLAGSTHYLIHFAPDEKLGVPGGYSYYRAGAVGKLVSLEKKPDIFSRTFSLASSSFVPYYFYPSTQDLHYGSTTPNEVKLPTPQELFSYSSNANMFDRLYLFLRFIQIKKSDFLVLRSSQDSRMKNGARIFIPEKFSKEFEGYLFNSTYRGERNTVQIVYTKSYEAARNIGNILEGNGIRVVDIKQDESSHSKTCTITVEAESRTADAISEYFRCDKRKGKAEVSDILIDVSGIERDWAIQ